MGNDKSTFSYLNNQNPRISAPGYIDLGNNNVFYPVEPLEILKLEEVLGYPLPSQLKAFYTEIGCGNLTTPFNAPEDYHFGGSNYIEPPSALIDFFEKKEDNEMMTPDAFEDLEPGDLPFFEIMNSSKFLIMKLNSENPNAVWYDDSIKISDSLEEFVWRLYYENPTFYDDIIEAYYKN